MIVLSNSPGRFKGNTKRPPDRRWSAAEGLTTRRSDLRMAGTHTMYLCRLTFGSLRVQEGRADG